MRAGKHRDLVVGNCGALWLAGVFQIPGLCGSAGQDSPSAGQVYLLRQPLKVCGPYTVDLHKAH